MVEAGPDLKLHFEFLRELHRARLHHLRAEAGQFQHLVVGNFADLLRVRHQPRVGGVDPVHVRVDLAAVGLQRRGQRDRGQVRAAPAERGDVPVVVLSLETRDDHDVARVEILEDFLRRNVGDLRLGVEAVGDDPRLRAGQRDGGDAERVQRHGGERDGLLLAGGDEHVELAGARLRRYFPRQLDQPVRHPRHGRDDHDQPVPGPVRFGDAGGDVADALGRADRGAAVFLDEERHGKGPSLAGIDAGDNRSRAAEGSLKTDFTAPRGGDNQRRTVGVN